MPGEHSGYMLSYKVEMGIPRENWQLAKTHQWALGSTERPCLKE